MNSGAQKALLLFFHPDFTVGFGISPNRPFSRFAGFTAGGELHPAPKMLAGTAPTEDFQLSLKIICAAHFYVNTQAQFRLNKYPCRALGTDIRDKAAMISEYILHIRYIFAQLIIGNIRLYRSCEAAAVNAVSARAVQEALGKRQGKRKALVGAFAGYILQQLPAAVPAFHNVLKEGMKVIILKRRSLLKHALILVKVVQGAENGSVANLLAQRADVPYYLLGNNLTQHLFAEVRGNRLHFGADCGIVIRQIIMRAARIYDNQSEALLGKIKRKGLNLRRFLN
jgi:hypothetical protein